MEPNRIWSRPSKRLWKKSKALSEMGPIRGVANGSREKIQSDKGQKNELDDSIKEQRA